MAKDTSTLYCLSWSEYRGEITEKVIEFNKESRYAHHSKTRVTLKDGGWVNKIGTSYVMDSDRDVAYQLAREKISQYASVLHRQADSFKTQASNLDRILSTL